MMTWCKCGSVLELTSQAALCNMMAYSGSEHTHALVGCFPEQHVARCAQRRAELQTHA